MWIRVQIPKNIVKGVDDFVKDKRNCFISRSDFIKSALRNYLERLSR